MSFSALTFRAHVHGFHQRWKGARCRYGEGSQAIANRDVEDAFIRLVGRSIEERTPERRRSDGRSDHVSARTRILTLGTTSHGITLNEPLRGWAAFSATFRVMFVEEARKSVEFKGQSDGAVSDLGHLNHRVAVFGR